MHPFAVEIVRLAKSGADQPRNEKGEFSSVESGPFSADQMIENYRRMYGRDPSPKQIAALRAKYAKRADVVRDIVALVKAQGRHASGQYAIAGHPAETRMLRSGRRAVPLRRAVQQQVRQQKLRAQQQVTDTKGADDGDSTAD